MKNINHSLCLNSSLMYIDDVLSINNCYFHTNVNSIYYSELQIKDPTESASSVSYFDILLEKD